MSLASAIIPAATLLQAVSPQAAGSGGAAASVPGIFEGLLGEAFSAGQPVETVAAAPQALLGAEALPQQIRSPLAGLIGLGDGATLDGETATAPEGSEEVAPDGSDENAPETDLAGLAGLIQPVVWTPPAASLPAEHAARPVQLSKADPLVPILPAGGLDAEPELAGAVPLIPSGKTDQAAALPAADQAIADSADTGVTPPLAAQVGQKAGPPKPETSADKPTVEKTAKAPALFEAQPAQLAETTPRTPLHPALAAAAALATRGGLEPGDGSATQGPLEHDGLIDPAALNATQARAAAASGPAHAAKPPAPPAPPVPLAQLGVHIGQMAAAGHTRFDISLDPPELGRIRVELDVDAMGQVRTHLIAERAETLDLLQREARQLEKSLADQGLSTGSGSLSFSLKQQGQDSQAQRQFENARGTRERQTQNQTQETVNPATIYRTLTLSALDMRI